MLRLPRHPGAASGASSGYFEGDAVSYRKDFEPPSSWLDRVIELEFPGVYRDAMVYLNGVVEIHGTEGSLVIPDPNTFTGRPAYVKPLGVLRDGTSIEQPWIEIEQEGAVTGRGLGLLEMVRAIAQGRPHIATGEVGRHVLEVMLAADESARTGSFVTVDSSVPPVPSMPVDFDPFARTL
jgi:predicted dehydrogenase